MDKFDTKHEFLVKHIYHGLKDLNTGFDSHYIKYFSQNDFEKVLDRIEEYGITLSGLEPWLNGDYYDVQIMEDHIEQLGDKWYRVIFEKYKLENQNLQHSASYIIPEKLLELTANNKD